MIMLTLRVAFTEIGVDENLTSTEDDLDAAAAAIAEEPPTKPGTDDEHDHTKWTTN